MALSESTKKMLVRIQNDNPERGDGKDLLDLIEAMRIIALEKSVTLEPTHSRWRQGASQGFSELLKDFRDALEGK